MAGAKIAEKQHPLPEAERPGGVIAGRILDSRWDDRTTLTVTEAGMALGLSRETAYAAVNAGTIPAIRIGRRLVVPRHALEKLLTSV